VAYDAGHLICRNATMSFATAHPPEVLAAERRTLEALNQGYLRAAEHADLEWYREHLADDYLCSTVDGALSDKAGFLDRIALRRGGSDFAAHDVRIRFVGDLALVHAGFSCTRRDGQVGRGRYTDVYARRGGRWLCVSAHFNLF
jgi:ketosteroid isomerase-like protein